MNTDDTIAAAHRQLAEAEAALQRSIGAVASARACLTVVEEENRELRRESLERRLEYFTEPEVAAIWKVSESTLARLRRARRIEHTLAGVLVRYSPAQVVQVGEVIAAKSRRPENRGQRTTEGRGQLRQVG